MTENQQIAQIAGALANEMADEARRIIRRYFRQPIAADYKSDESPVTIADREVEAMIRHKIAANFPDHAIYGEEFGITNQGADWAWHLDPIDGTKSFVSGSPVFVSQMALLYKGAYVLGQIDQPIIGERWFAGADGQTLFNGEPVHVSNCKILDEAVFYITAPDMWDEKDLPKLATIQSQSRFIRYSHDGYTAGLMAMGCVDLFIDANVQPYDVAALVTIIRGAGGVITNWQGEEPSLDRTESIIAAATPALHAQALAVITS